MMDKTQFKQLLKVMKSSLQVRNSVAGTTLILNFAQYKKKEEIFAQYLERIDNFAKLKSIEDDRVVMKETFLSCVGSEKYKL